MYFEMMRLTKTTILLFRAAISSREGRNVVIGVDCKGGDTKGVHADRGGFTRPLTTSKLYIRDCML